MTKHPLSFILMQPPVAFDRQDITDISVRFIVGDGWAGLQASDIDISMHAPALIVADEPVGFDHKPPFD